jgi:sec-independent protein translocase protein TatA
MNSPLIAVFGIGGTELIVILALALLLFGGTKLPALARGLGLSVKEFKKASQEDDKSKSPEAKDADPSKPGGAS